MWRRMVGMWGVQQRPIWKHQGQGSSLAFSQVRALLLLPKTMQIETETESEMGGSHTNLGVPKRSCRMRACSPSLCWAAT